MTPENITASLDEQALARVDALAAIYRITREEMLARIVQTGLLAQERQVREVRERSTGGGS